MPAAEELGRGLDVVYAIFRDLAILFFFKQTTQIKPGDASAFRTCDAEAFAEEIQIEFSNRAVKGKLLQQIAMLARVITVSHEISGCFNAKES